ncbi:MAG: GlsB/YeaQ/YmgE family stress response membrane protein [Chloroflexota bacterium]
MKLSSSLNLIVAGVVIVFLLGIAMVVTAGVWNLALTLFMAGLIGWAADLVAPGDLPGGWLGAVLTGIIGGFLGKLILGNFGPHLFGYHVIPAFVGAVIVAVAAHVVFGRKGGRSLGRL